MALRLLVAMVVLARAPGGGAPASPGDAATPVTMPPLRIGAYAAGAAGVLLVTAGAYFGGRVLSLQSKARRQAANGQADPVVIQDRHNAARWQWVGLGVGAAFLAGGAVAYFFSRETGGDHAVALAPVLAPGAAGATLRLLF